MKWKYEKCKILKRVLKAQILNESTSSEISELQVKHYYDNESHYSKSRTSLNFLSGKFAVFSSFCNPRRVGGDSPVGGGPTMSMAFPR